MFVKTAKHLLHSGVNKEKTCRIKKRRPLLFLSNSRTVLRKKKKINKIQSAAGLTAAALVRAHCTIVSHSQKMDFIFSCRFICAMICRDYELLVVEQIAMPCAPELRRV